MHLQTRLFLSVVVLLVITVIATAFVTARGATQSMLAQVEEDGITIAQLLARSSDFAVRVPQQVEDVVGDQMVVEARIAAHLVAVAEGRAGMSPEEINAILRDITGHTALDEFWITDETAHAYLRNNLDIDFTFNPDPDEQPQAHIFYPLLHQQDGVVIQEARQREVDPKVFKYVGVSGVDRPRIVQVGYEATFLEELSLDMNAQKLVDELTGQGNVAAVRLVDAQRRCLAASTQPVKGIGERLSTGDLDLLAEAFHSKQVRSSFRENVLRVAVPLLDQKGDVQVVAFVYLLADSVRRAIQTSVVRSVLVSAAVIVAGAFISLLLSSGITQPIRRLTAAARAMEEGKLSGEEIASFSHTGGNDEVSRLSQAFGQMVDRLDQQVHQLETIYQIGQVITANVELDKTLKAILEETRRIIPYSAAEVCLSDPGRNVLQVSAWAGAEGSPAMDTTGCEYTFGAGYTGWIGGQRQGLLVPDVDTCSELTPIHRELKPGVMINSFVGVPMLFGDKLVGTLELIHTEKNHFDQDHLQLLSLIATQAAVTIENARLVQRREERLKQQIEELRIEIDEAKQARQVAEITETEYFQRLREQAGKRREKAKEEQRPCNAGNATDRREASVASADAPFAKNTQARSPSS
jgi:GAF domain-containing protein